MIKNMPKSETEGKTANFLSHEVYVSLMQTLIQLYSSLTPQKHLNAFYAIQDCLLKTLLLYKFTEETDTIFKVARSTFKEFPMETASIYAKVFNDFTVETLLPKLGCAALFKTSEMDETSFEEALKYSIASSLK